MRLILWGNATFGRRSCSPGCPEEFPFSKIFCHGSFSCISNAYMSTRCLLVWWKWLLVDACCLSGCKRCCFLWNPSRPPCSGVSTVLFWMWVLQRLHLLPSCLAFTGGGLTKKQKSTLHTTWPWVYHFKALSPVFLAIILNFKHFSLSAKNEFVRKIGGKNRQKTKGLHASGRTA